MTRRELFLGAASAALLPSWAKAGSTEAAPKRFRFVHATDLHIQPERGAPEGVSKAVKAILALRPRPVLVLTGGDHVMDVLAGGRERAETQFRLLDEALKPLEMPVIPTVGNHDVYGWGDKDVDRNDPLYGKRMFEERTGMSSQRREMRIGDLTFLVADSVKKAEGSAWKAELGEDELSWLDGRLATPGRKVVMTHVPALSTIAQTTEGSTAPAPAGLVLSDGKALFDLAAKHRNVEAVLQGHTHIVEDIEYAGTRYITGGAVCGDWWKGARLGLHPEGFTVYDWDGENLKRTYVAYGWTARA